MVLLYPAIAEAEFAQAALELRRLCDGKLEGSSWQNVNWTGDELQIQQLRNETFLSSTSQDLDLEVDELEEVDLVRDYLSPIQASLTPVSRRHSAAFAVSLPRAKPSTSLSSYLPHIRCLCYG